MVDYNLSIFINDKKPLKIQATLGAIFLCKKSLFFTVAVFLFFLLCCAGVEALQFGKHVV